MPPENAEPTQRPLPPEQRLSALFDSSVPEAEAPRETKPEAKPKAAPVETPDEPEAAEPAEAKEATEAPDDADAISVESLGELAEALGVEVSELYNLRIPVTSTDGERSDVSLGEWKDSYQAAQKSTKLQQELETRRAAFEQETAQATQQMQSRLKEVDALVNATEGQLLREYQGTDWDRLRADDPSEWAARRQDFIERQNAINAAKQRAHAEVQRLEREQTERVRKFRAEALQRERPALKDAVPEWKDETKAKAEQAQLFDYLVSSGFRTEDVSSIIDHRVVVLARKAMLWDKRSKEGQEATKKLVRVAPKRVLKPGAAQTKADKQADAAAVLRARLKKSGRMEDFAALISRS